MKFGPVNLQEAKGKIMAHNISDRAGKRRIRKGTLLDESHLELLESIGLSEVYVAELGAHDLPEEEAAPRIASTLAGDHIELQGAATGRTNLIAQRQGVLYVDHERLEQVNWVDGITVSTLPQHRVVGERGILASVKIIPYGLSMSSVEQVEAIGTGGDPVIALNPLIQREIGLLLTGRPGLEARLREDFIPPLQDRIEALGSKISSVEFHPSDRGDVIEGLTNTLNRLAQEGVGLILVAGETAIMDSRDILPQALVDAGGELESLGAPVDPGNLLMLGYLQGIAVVGAPGCARSRKENVVDWILPRLLSGEKITRQEIATMGLGGLLEDVKERPQRRSAVIGETDE